MFNIAAGEYSAIPGGRGLTLDANADGSFGFLGANTGGNNMTIAAANTAVFGNTDLWLANNDGAASELRFFEDYSGSGAFPNTANYTAFKAQTQTGDITYTLPAALPAAASALTPDLGSGILQTDNTGSLQWRQLVSTTVLLPFPLSPPGSFADATLTVNGARDGDVVTIGVPNAAMAFGNVHFSGWVSANNIVTVRFYNNTAVPIFFASLSFGIVVMKP